MRNESLRWIALLAAGATLLFTLFLLAVLIKSGKARKSPLDLVGSLLLVAGTFLTLLFAYGMGANERLAFWWSGMGCILLAVLLFSLVRKRSTPSQ